MSVPANNWGGHSWTFWQYDDCGSVAGISGCVDLDRFNGMDLAPVTVTYAFMPPSPAPLLASIDPPTVAAGSPATTVTLQGANFASGVSTAYWNGVPLPTTVVSPTTLTAVVPAAQVVGAVPVMVINAPPGGGASPPLMVTITLPPAQLSVTPSAAVIGWSQTVTLDVAVAGAGAAAGAGRSVTLQRMQANETQWLDIATLTTDASGHATFDYRPPVNTQFQAVFAGAPDLGPGTSPAVRVVVRQVLVLRPTNAGTVKSVPAGTSVTFVGTVRPIGPTLAPARVTFQLWRQVNGKWVFVTKRDVNADASGRASLPWAFTSRGQWYVRAVADPTLTSANSTWSPPERFLVY
jgi:hypothetical protein